MCGRCGTEYINRLGVAAAGLSLSGMPALAANRGKTGLSPDEALATLKEGNARYVDNPQVCLADLAKARADVATHQEP
jgi:carbonic anhydrase